MRFPSLVLAAACLSCGTDPPAASNDGGTNDGAADAHRTCDTLYVSPSGDDLARGCEPAKAKKTIGAAISAAAASPLVVRIRVCKGSYRETIELTQAVSLEGGYSCDAFVRTPAYGYPTFDAANETVVQSDASALTATGALGPDVVVDGFTFRGSDLDGSPAVAIHDGPALTLSNNRIVGGSGSGYGAGSKGLDAKNAAIDIVHNDIDGGKGTTDTLHVYGSMGVSVFHGAARIHDNHIRGGDGTLGGDDNNYQQIASLALFVGEGDFVGAAAISGNTIEAGRGTTMGKNPTSHIGVSAVAQTPTTVELIGNTIGGGEGSCSGPCAKVAISANGLQSIRIANNRIYGGDAGHPFANTDAVAIYSSKAVTIVDNAIHAGNREGTVINGARAVFLAYVADAIVAHNTVFVPRSTAGTALYFLPTTAQHLTVENDVFLGNGGARAIDGPRCNGLDVVRNNAFGGFGELFHGRGVLPQCKTDALALTVTDAESTLVADGADAKDNVELSATCTTSACATVASCGAQSDQCAEGLLAGFSHSDLGLAGLVGAGWPLAPNAPCKLSHGGLDLTSTIGGDLLGKPRTLPVSMGAVEADGPCSP